MFNAITILTYHTIEPENSQRITEDEKFYNITPSTFRNQMSYLKDNSYMVMTPKDLMDAKNKGFLPSKAVMITFDDGHISHYEAALPILKEFNFKGTFFLVVNNIGKENYLDWQQANILKNNGMYIGSHGMNHEFIDKIPDPLLITELEASKLELEENLSNPIDSFSIPFGYYSPRISDFARGMGYKYVFTSFAGKVSLDADPYHLPRMVVLNNYSMKEFISIVKGSPVFLIRKHFQSAAKTIVKTTIGRKGYIWVKRVALSR